MYILLFISITIYIKEQSGDGFLFFFSFPPVTLNSTLEDKFDATWLFCPVSPSTARSAKLHIRKISVSSCVPLTLFQKLEVRNKCRVSLGQSSEPNVSNV